MIGFGHGRRARLAALTLATIWMATLAAAESSVTPPMRCQRLHMPCCPGKEGCSPAQCSEQVSERAETQLIEERVQETRSSRAADSLPAVGVPATPAHPREA